MINSVFYFNYWKICTYPSILYPILGTSIPKCRIHGAFDLSYLIRGSSSPSYRIRSTSSLSYGIRVTCSLSYRIRGTSSLCFGFVAPQVFRTQSVQFSRQWYDTQVYMWLAIPTIKWVSKGPPNKTWFVHVS